MPTFTDDQLAHLAATLEADQHRSGCWTTPARLLALAPLPPEGLDTALAAGTVPWRRLGEGNPYHLLDALALDPAETSVVALVVHGWAFPPDDPTSWYGRPSQHPGRLRARTATVVTVDGRQASAIRLQQRDVVVDAGGEGPLLAALLGAWAATPAGAGRPHPVAHCRRDRR